MRRAEVLTGAQDAPLSPAAKRWTLVAAVLGSSMAFVDGTVVNVALPAIQRALDADAFQAQWVVEAYALFLAALLLTGGAFGDRFGRRRIFMIGVGLFTAASLACGLARAIDQLIVARAVQGVGAALLVPGSLALLSAGFPKAERGRAIGTWSAFSGITAAIGPVLGGFLVDRFDWSWAFFINLPLGALLLVICALRVPESRGAPVTGGVDVWGACLATLGLAGIVYAFIEAPGRGWISAPVGIAALVGVLSLGSFLVVEATSRAPMLPLALFRRRDFSGANLLTLLLYAALGGGLYFLPLSLVQVQGYSATAAGAALLPFIAIMFTLSRWAGRLVDRFGPKRPLMIGPAIAALGFALFALPDVGASYWLGYFPAVCVLGLGMSITVAPLTTTVMNSVGTELSGVGSGVNNAVSRAAALLSIAVFSVLLAAAFNASLDAYLAHAGLAPAPLAELNAQRQKLAGISIPAGLDEAAAGALRHAIGSAFVAGFRWVMAVCAGLALASALSAWWLIGGAAGGASGASPGPQDDSSIRSSKTA